MKTRTLTIHSRRPQPGLLAEAARVLLQDGLVAFPTETVYGLGANALSPKALKKIFRAKGRPSDNPLIIHVARADDLEELVDSVPSKAKRLIRTFWPGPLTLVLRKSERVPAEATAGLNTVAVRMPAHPVALALIRAAGVPIAAPSANSSGKPSPTSATHVQEDLNGKIDLVLDGGPTRIGLESTVIDMTPPIPVVLRPGKVSLEQLRSVLGKVRMDRSVLGSDSTRVRPRSPGMKYRHYAPQAELIVVEGSLTSVSRKIRNLIRTSRKGPDQIAVLTTSRRRHYDNALTVFIGSGETSIAHHLFRRLREIDATPVRLVLAEGIKAKGLGLAIMNRLRKAAGAPRRGRPAG